MIKWRAVSLNGWCVASIREEHNTPVLRIMSPSNVCNGTYSPAECITIFGDGAIRALRDFLSEVLAENA